MLRLPKRTVDPPPVAGGSLHAFIVGSSLFLLLLMVGATMRDVSLSPLTWYIARSSGLLLIVTAWLSMITGMGLTTKLLDRLIARHVALSVHSYAFHLWYGFLLLHVMSILLDPTVNYGPRELMVPFSTATDRWWIGFGVIAGELMIVVGGSAMLRRVVGYTVWRRLHFLSGPAFFLGTFHGIGSGTDTGRLWVDALYLIAMSSAVLMITYRVLRWNARTDARNGLHTAGKLIAEAGD